MWATQAFIDLQRKIEKGVLVEVVRCGQCAYAGQINDGFFCKLWRSFSVEAEDGFCCYGVRKSWEEISS